MAFMQPEYTNEDFYDVENDYGESWLVPADLVGSSPSLEDFRDYVEGEPADFEKQSGWFFRLSAPGYMDATEWSGPYGSLQEAKKELEELYEVDPDTGEELAYEENPEGGTWFDEHPIGSAAIGAGVGSLAGATLGGVVGTVVGGAGLVGSAAAGSAGGMAASASLPVAATLAGSVVGGALGGKAGARGDDKRAASIGGGVGGLVGPFGAAAGGAIGAAVSRDKKSNPALNTQKLKKQLLK